MKVLLIDDGVERILLRQLLEAAGFHVHDTATGENGIDVARTFRPDVIICGVAPAGMSGWEVASQMKSNPEFNGAFALMGSCIPVEDDDELRKKGVDMFILRSSDIQIIRAWLERVKASR